MKTTVIKHLSWRKIISILLVFVLIVGASIPTYTTNASEGMSTDTILPDNHTVLISGTNRVFLYNQKTTTKGIVLTYTVEKAEATIGQNGVVGTYNPLTDYPYENGYGQFVHSNTDSGMLKQGYTYVFKIGANAAGNGVAWEGVGTNGSETHTVSLQTPWRTANETMKYFGILLDNSSFDVKLTNVTCVEQETGRDLGVASRSSNVAVINQDASNVGEQVVLTGETNDIYIHTKKKTTLDPVTMIYTVTSVESKGLTQGICVTQNPTVRYPFEDAIGWYCYDQDGTNADFLKQGFTYTIHVAIVGNEVLYRWNATNGTEIYSGTTAAKHFKEGCENSEYFGLLFMNQAPKAVLSNVRFIDAEGNDLGVRKNINDVSINYDQYLLPIWEGDTVYDESVMPFETENGTIEPISLMYDADEILSVKSSDLKIEYQEGDDYELVDGKLVILPDGNIPRMTYASYYPVEQTTSSKPRTNGGYIYYSEAGILQKNQVVVTYTHSDTWKGTVPERQGASLTNIITKMKNQESVNVVFYGDSITEGCNASGHMGVSPYMKRWTEIVVENLQKTYEYEDIVYINSAKGGMDSTWAASNVQERVVEKDPDLLFLAWGMNDVHTEPSTFKTNIVSMIEAARSNNADCDIILVATMLPNEEFVDNYGNQALFLNVLKEIASEYDNIAVADMTTMHEELLKHKLFRDMTGNNVNHTNDFMTRVYAQVMLETLQVKEANTHTVQISSGKNVFLHNDKATNKGVVFTYTVESLGANAGQCGVIGTANPWLDYPWDQNNGQLRYNHPSRTPGMLNENWTYEFTIQPDTEGSGIIWSYKASKDGIEQTVLLENKAGTKTVAEALNSFGIWLESGATAVLSNVTCVEVGTGRDLGVVSHNQTAAVIKDEVQNTGATVIMDGSSTKPLGIYNKEKTIHWPVTMTYTVESMEEVTATQGICATPNTPASNGYMQGKNIGVMKYGTLDLLKEGYTYTIRMSVRNGGFVYTWSSTNGTEIHSSGAGGYTDGSYTWSTDSPEASHFGIEFLNSYIPKGVLSNVSFTDSKGRDLGVSTSCATGIRIAKPDTVSFVSGVSGTTGYEITLKANKETFVDTSWSGKAFVIDGDESVDAGASIASVDATTVTINVPYNLFSKAGMGNHVLTIKKGNELGGVYLAEDVRMYIAGGMVFAESPNVDEYTINISSGAHMFFHNQIATDKGVVFTYTVKSTTTNISQNGVVGTTNPHADYPYSGGEGHLRHENNQTTDVMLDQDCTYEFTITPIAGDTTKTSYDVRAIAADGTEKTVQIPYQYGGNTTGKVMNFFGIWLDGNKPTAVLTNVTCVEVGTGKDLGVASNTTLAAVIKTEADNEGSDIILDGSATQPLCIYSEQKTVNWPVTMTYTVKTVESVDSRLTQGICATPNTPASNGYMQGKNIGVMKYGTLDLLKEGYTYTIRMSVRNGGFVYTWSSTNGTEIHSSGAGGSTDGSYTWSTDSPEASHFGIEFLNSSIPKGVLSNVSFTDSEGRDLGVTVNKPSGVIIVDDTDAEYTIPYTANEFATYRTEETYTYPQALGGYVFAGWYTNEACTTSIEADAKSAEATVYAKYVSDKVLQTKAQITSGTTSRSATTDLRLVTTIDCQDYQEVGFYVTSGSTKKSYKQTTSYNRIVAADSKNAFTYTPDFFSDISESFVTVVLTGVRVKGTNLERPIKVQAYWVTADGTTIVGGERTITIQMGINAMQSVICE